MTDPAETNHLPVFNASPWHSDGTPALGIGQRCWPYAELAGLVAEREQRLRGLGLGPGQVLICGVDSGLDLILNQHALARVGAALLPVPSDSHPERLDALTRQTGAEWHWVPGANGGLLKATGRTPSRDPAATEGLALLIQTSGSSGAPKVVMLTQGAVLGSCTLVNSVLALGPGDEWLCCLPLQHVGGLAISYRCALAGATLRLQSGLGSGFDAAAVSADLARGRVTHLSLVPPMLARLLDSGIGPPRSLRVLLLGGQALNRALARRAIDAGWPLYLTYGMSETFSQVATAPYSANGAPTLVGPPLPGVELDCTPCGETPAVLRLHGPILMAGYANPQRRPGDGLRDGWLTTSDLGCVDQTGALHLLGRADEMLVIGGVNVLPTAVEDCIAGAPGVEAVAVVGVPHPVWGQTLAACYAGGATPDALEDWCRVNLAGAQRPRIFIRRAELPLLASGKQDRAAIVHLASAGGQTND